MWPVIWRPSWREKRDRERRRSLSVPKQRLGTKRTRCHVCRAPQRKSRRGAGSSHIGPGVGTPWAKRTHHTPPRGAQTQAQLPTPYLGVSQPHAGAGVAPCSPPPPLRPLIFTSLPPPPASSSPQLPEPLGNSAGLTHPLAQTPSAVWGSDSGPGPAEAVPFPLSASCSPTFVLSSHTQSPMDERAPRPGALPSWGLSGVSWRPSSRWSSSTSW